jgi:hypothetical protein
MLQPTTTTILSKPQMLTVSQASKAERQRTSISTYSRGGLRKMVRYNRLKKERSRIRSQRIRQGKNV